MLYSTFVSKVYYVYHCTGLEIRSAITFARVPKKGPGLDKTSHVLTNPVAMVTHSPIFSLLWTEGKGVNPWEQAVGLEAASCKLLI